MLERLDEHHLEYATAQGRALYSFNVGDFYRLRLAFLAQGKTHMGIILAQQQRYTVGEQMRRLLRLTATRSPEDMQKPGGVSQFLGLRPSVSALAMRVDNWSKGSVGRGVQSCEDVAGWRTARLVVYAV